MIVKIPVHDKCHECFAIFNMASGGVISVGEERLLQVFSKETDAFEQMMILRRETGMSLVVRPVNVTFPELK